MYLFVYAYANRNWKNYNNVAFNIANQEPVLSFQWSFWIPKHVFNDLIATIFVESITFWGSKL